MRRRLQRLILCALGTLACSSSHQSSTDAAPDVSDATAAVPDATAVSEAAPEASQRSMDPPGYEAFWYPECDTADGDCPADTCRRNDITVLSDPCGPYQSLQVGCVSNMTVLSGWYCYRRQSNGEHVWSQYPPKGGDFVMCTDVGNLPPAPGTLCRDAGADTD